jgi:hypothetical protein
VTRPGGGRLALAAAASLVAAFVACIDVDGLRRGSPDAGAASSGGSSGGGSSGGGSSGGGSSGGSSGGGSSGCPACAFGQGEVCCVPASGPPVCVGDGGACAEGTTTVGCVSSATCPDGGGGIPVTNLCCVAVNATATIGCRNAALPDRCKDDVEVCDPRGAACRGGGACTGPAPAGAPFLRTCK